MVLAKLKKYDEALAALDKAPTWPPDSARWWSRPASYGLQGNMKAPWPNSTRPDDIEPGNLAVLLLRAGVLQDLGEKAKALADIDRSWN